MISIDPVFINLLWGAVGGVLGYLTFLARTKNESEEDGNKAGVIASDLGYLKKGIEDINHKLERQDERYVELVQRVSTCEASAKQAHKRLDDLCGKVEDQHE